MANSEHLEILKQGVEVWNRWREENREIWPDLRGANLSMAELIRANLSESNLSGADLSGADLSKANLSRANLWLADLHGADLHGANLYVADFSEADLREARLYDSDLHGANLRGAHLRKANIRGADLSGASLVYTELEYTDLTGCSVHGVSVWNVNLTGAIQKDLIITLSNEPVVTVDDLRIAQFIYLLLDNEQIRDVIDTITSKAVLILGRFTEDRKQVLDALRDELRKRNYLPILFDFEKPVSRDLTETISTLAHMSRFIIADVTDAKSIPQELTAIVPDLPSVPVRLLIQQGATEYAMLGHFKRYPWVIETYQYKDTIQLLGSLTTQIIEPAEAKVEELKQK